MSDITITSTSILIVYGSNGCAIDRTTGIISPEPITFPLSMRVVWPFPVPTMLTITAKFRPTYVRAGRKL